MQKPFLFILFLLIIPCNIFGQKLTTTSGGITANLIYPISLKSGAGNLDFGEIILTGLPIIEKIKPKAGKEFIIQGQKGRSVTVYYKNVSLFNYEWASKFGGKFGRLKFFPKVVNYNNKMIRNGESIFLKANGSIGEAKIYVGGKIKIRANQPIGVYRGSFVISVAY